MMGLDGDSLRSAALVTPGAVELLGKHLAVVRADLAQLGYGFKGEFAHGSQMSEIAIF
jgi:hypothetical protein